MRTWLFRPFDRIAGGAALLAGLVAIAITAIGGWYFRIYTDGVVDLHYGPTLPAWTAVFFGLLNWLILAAAVWGIGHWLTATRYRVIDLFATQALARWPMLVGVLIMSTPLYRDVTAGLSREVALQAQGSAAEVAVQGSALLAAAMSIPVLLAIAWMVWLAYHAYALVFNLKGGRAVVGFIGALLVAEIASKFAAQAVVAMAAQGTGGS